MSTAAFPLPDGTSVAVPTSLSFDQAEAYARNIRPDAFPAQSGGGINPIRDIPGSVVSGIGSLIQFPGQVGTLLGADPNNAFVRAGESVSQFGKDIQSPGLREREEKIQAALKAAEENGLAAEAKEALIQYAANPYVTFNKLIEQLPNLLVSFGAGKVAQVGVSAAAKAASREVAEKSLERAGLAGAAGVMAPMQGADVGQETYNRAYEAAIRKGYPEQQAKQLALAEAREAALKATAVSAGTMVLLPGAERALFAKQGTGMLKAAGRTGAGETLQEGTEEGSGAYFAGAGEQAVDPSVDPWRGVGSRATTGAILGGLMGAGVGGTRAYGEKSAADEAERRGRSERDALARQEKLAKEQAEEARKKSPEYLKKLETDVAERKGTIEAIQARITALGKPAAGTPEALELADLRKQRAVAIQESKELFREYNGRKAEISAAQKRAEIDALSPLEYQMRQYGVDMDTPAAVFTGEQVAPPAPVPPAEQYAKQQAALIAQIDNGTMTEADYVSVFMRDPAMAEEVTKNKIDIPGLDRKQRDIVHSGIKMSLAELRKKQAAEERLALEQRDADLRAQIPRREEPNPLATWAEDVQALTERTQGSTRTEEGDLDYKAIGLDEQDKPVTGFLDRLFETLGEGQGEIVGVPETVKPMANAKNTLDKIDALLGARDDADKRTELSFNSGNRDAGIQAAQDRENASESLRRLAEEDSAAGEVIRQRRTQDGALADVAALVDDLRYGVTLDSQNTQNRALASSTTETLKKQIAKARISYIDAVIKEAAAVRAAYGRTLNKVEALRAAADIRRAFDEWVTRAGALPRSAVEEERIINSYQTRSGKTVGSEARTERVDPRPLSERQFGAYREAVDVLRQQIRGIASNLASVPMGKMVREEPLLKTQFSQTEERRRAAERGDTAETRKGQLVKRREFVSNLIEKALGRKSPYRVEQALRNAKDAIDAGEGFTDVVSDVEGQRFTAGLLDAAEELANRVIDGLSPRTRLQELKLIRQVEEALKNPPTKEVPGGQLDLFAPENAAEETTYAERVRAAEESIVRIQKDKGDPAERIKRIGALRKYLEEIRPKAAEEARENKAAVSSLRKEQERLRGDIAFVRASARNFANAPQVKAGRAAVDKLRELITLTKRAIDAKTSADVAAVNRILDIINRLNSFSWFQKALPAGKLKTSLRDLVIYKKRVPQLKEELNRLVKTTPRTQDLADALPPIKPATGAFSPTKEDILSRQVQGKLQDVRAAYYDAVEKALAQIKSRALPPELQRQMDAAQTKFDAAQKWISELKQELAKATETYKQNLAVVKADFDAAANIIANTEADKDRVNAVYYNRRKQTRAARDTYQTAVKNLESQLKAEEQRLQEAEELLAAVKDQIDSQKQVAEAVSSAAKDRLVVWEQHNLDYLVGQIERQGYVIDKENGRVTSIEVKAKEAVQWLEDTLKRQIEALASAKRLDKKDADFKAARQAEQKFQTAMQRRLDLPGVRREGGVTVPVGSATNEDIESAQEELARVRREMDELAERRAEGEQKKASLQDKIEALNDERERLTDKLKDIPNKQAEQRKAVEGVIRDIVREIGGLKLLQEEQGLITKEDLEDLRMRRKRFAGPVTRKQTAAPTTMRTGSAESNAATRARDAQAAGVRGLTKAERKTRLDVAQALQKEKTGQADRNFDEDTELAQFRNEDRFFSPRQDASDITVGKLKKARNHPTNGMSFVQAAEWLLGNTKSPVKRALMARVVETLRNAGGTVEFAVDFEGDSKSVGNYDIGSGTISITPRIIDDTQLVDDTLFHELVHAATVAGMRIDSALRGRINSLMSRVEEWVKTPAGKRFIETADVGGALTEDGRVYAFKNAEEFIAEAFSSPDFQLILRQVPAGNKSVFSRLAEFIGRMFGAKTPAEFTAMEEAISLGEEAMLSTWIASEVNADTGAGVFNSVRRQTPQHENEDTAEASKTMIGKPSRGFSDYLKAFTGLGFRTRVVDNWAAVTEALRKGDYADAIQAQYDIMNYQNRSHLTHQIVLHGAPTRSLFADKTAGKQLQKVEVEEGASLRGVVEKLKDVKGYGNQEAVHEAFTLMAVGKRAQTLGWDRVFGDDAKDSPEAKAKKAAARKEADRLAKELDDGASPFKAAYDEYQEFNKNMLKFVRDSGVISDDEFRQLSKNRNYTPLFRENKTNKMLELELDSGRVITVGRLSDEAHLEQLVGGADQIMDFFSASVRNAAVLTDAALHNFAVRNVAFSLKALDAAQRVGDKLKDPNIIEFRKDGETQRFLIDSDAIGIPTDLIVKGMAGVPMSMPTVIRMMGVPAQWTRKLVTRNPVYVMRQLIRDPMAAWLVTGANTKPVLGTLTEVAKAVTGKADKTLERRGITGGMTFGEDIRDIEDLQDRVSKEPNLISLAAIKLQDMAHGADSITRRNVYQGALDKGLSEAEASLATWESMPFSKRGTSTTIRMMNHIIPFLSAAIQGWDTLYRAAKNDMPMAERVNVRNKLLTRGAMIGALTMMYAAAMSDEEPYKNANTDERLMNWFIPVPGTGTAIKAPIPFELGIFFKMIPEAMVRTMMGKDGNKEAMAVLSAGLNMLPHAGLPQAVKPLVEVMLDKSFFTMRPIEPAGQDGIDISQRSAKGTSELSKALGFDVDIAGKQYGLSPTQIEYLLSQYSAGLYGAFAALVDTVLPAPTAAKPDRTLAELPLFKAVLQREDAGGRVNELYEKMEQFSRATRTYKKLVDRGELEEAQRYAEKNREKIVKGDVASKMKASIDKLNELENKIRAAPMDGADKKAAIDRIRINRTRVADQYLAALGQGA